MTRYIRNSRPFWTWMSLAGILLVFGIYFGIYVTVSGANVAYLAWFAHVPMIEKYFAGTWTWRDAIERYGEHGLFGYNLLLIANLKYFRLNVFFDIYLNALVVTSVGILVAVKYYRTEILRVRHALAVLLFVPIAFSLFSVCQQSSGAMETQVRLGTLFFIIAAYWIDNSLLNTGSGTGIYAMLFGAFLIGVAVLVFGTLYTFAGFPGIVLLCVYAAFTRKEVRLYAAFVLATLALSVVLYIRFYDLKLEPAVGVPMGLLERLVFSIRFLAAYLGSAILGRTLWEDRVTTSDVLMFWNGILLCAVYLFSIWLFWRSKMQRITWLPILMMAYTVGVGLLVLIGRGPMFGWTGGTNYWYAVHVKFALAGCLWIFAHALLLNNPIALESREKNPRERSTDILYFSVILCLVIAVGVSNYFDWKRAPYVRRYFEAMIPYGLAPLDEMPEDQHGHTPFRVSLAETRSALRVFRAHNLTFYSDFTLPADQREHDILNSGKITQYARLGPGWYEAESTSRWMSGRAQIFFHSGPKGVVIIDGYLPGILSPNSMALSVESLEIISKPLSEGTFTVIAQLPADRELMLTISLEKHLVPSLAGLNGDQRDLGAMITNIATR